MRISRLFRRHDAGKAAADQALARAEKDRKSTERQRPEVERLAHRLRVLREENHFAERIRAAMEGGP